MALTITNRGTGTNNTAATTLVCAPTSTIPAGSTGILAISYDNAGSAGASTIAPATITDSVGNKWYLRQNPLYDNGAASAGIEGAIYTAHIITALTSANNVTVTWLASTSVTAKVYTFTEVTPGAGNRVEYLTGGVATGATAANLSMSAGTVTSGDVVFGAYMAESVSAVTADSDTTNGSWSTQQTATVGSTTSGVRIASQAKVTTATGAQSYDVTVASQDRTGAWITLDEVPITVSANFTADAVLMKEVSASFTADAVLAAGSGPATPTKVQGLGSAESAGASGTTIVLTLSGLIGGTTTVGNHVIVYAGAGGSLPTSVVDSKSNTYQLDVQSDNTDPRGAIFSARIDTALVDGDTITVTYAASTSTRVVAATEFSNLASSGWFDVATHLASTVAGVSADSGLTAANSTTKSLVAGMVVTSAITAFTFESLSPAWSLDHEREVTGATIRGIHAGHRVPSDGPTQYATKATWTTSRNWKSLVAVYKPASGGGGPTTVTGSFTADAILLKTASASATADAILLKTTSASYTADAILRTILTGSFTADAFLTASVTGSFTANAVLKGTVTSSFTGDSILRRTVIGGSGGTATLVQHKKRVDTSSIVLTSSPTTDNVLLFFSNGRSGFVTAPSGFTTLLSLSGSGSTPPFVTVAYRKVLAGDGTTWSPGAGGFADISEWSGVDIPDATDSLVMAAGTFSANQSLAPSGTGVIVGMFSIHTDQSDRIVHVTGGTTLVAEDWFDAGGFGPYGSIGYINQPGPATATYQNTSFTTAIKAGVNLPVKAGGFSADAVIRTVPTGSFTADAILKKIVSPTFTADAILFKTQSGSYTADAILRLIESFTLTSNAILKRTEAFTFTADAVIDAGTTVVNGSFTANAVLRRVEPFTFAADAILRRIEANVFTADAFLRVVVSGTFTANAVLLKTIAASVTADAVLKRTESFTFSADAMLRRIGAATFSADAILKRTESGSFTADAWLKLTPIWVSPANFSVISNTPVLVFKMPASSKPMFFHLQLDKANTFDTADLRQYKSNLDQTGWEYWDGSAWQPHPDTGVPAIYAGNEARYTVQTALTNGTWYRRVRGVI